VPIIDEIIILEPSLFEVLDYIARRVRRQASVPFGGMQMILRGDLLQLASIARTRDGNPPRTP
jgi:ATP-dependent DNA helicase PIF1